MANSKLTQLPEVTALASGYLFYTAITGPLSRKFDVDNMFASTAEINTGTETHKSATPLSLASSDQGKRTFIVQINGEVALTSGDGKAYFTRVPEHLTGWTITGVGASMTGGTALVDIQIHNVTQATDLLSTSLTIDANETDSSTAATPAVINTSNDDLTTGDRFRVDIDDEGTATLNLEVQFAVEKA